jgi:hypothetical protein
LIAGPALELPNANTVSDVPGVNVEFDFGAGIAFGFG